jgi:hypothetical protein
LGTISAFAYRYRETKKTQGNQIKLFNKVPGIRNVNVTVMSMITILESEIVIQAFSSAFNLL